MSDFLVTTTIERPKQQIPSAQQPGAAAPAKWTAPKTSEPRRAGEPIKPEVKKAMRVRKMTTGGAKPPLVTEEIGNTDLLDDAPKVTHGKSAVALDKFDAINAKRRETWAAKREGRPVENPLCAHEGCASPRVKGQAYCRPHKSQRNRESRQRVAAEKAQKRRLALQERQKTIAAAKTVKAIEVDRIEVNVEPLSIPLPPKPTAGLRVEQLVRGMRDALKACLDTSTSREAAALAIFDGLASALIG